MHYMPHHHFGSLEPPHLASQPSKNFHHLTTHLSSFMIPLSGKSNEHQSETCAEAELQMEGQPNVRNPRSHQGTRAGPVGAKLLYPTVLKLKKSNIIFSKQLYPSSLACSLQYYSEITRLCPITLPCQCGAASTTPQRFVI